MDHTSQGDDAAWSEADPGGDSRPGPDPHPVADRDSPGDQIETRAVPVMIAGAEIDPLGDAAVVPNPYPFQIVNPEIFAQPGMIPHGQLPRELHFQSGLYHHTGSDDSAK